MVESLLVCWRSLLISNMLPRLTIHFQWDPDHESVLDLHYVLERTMKDISLLQDNILQQARDDKLYYYHQIKLFSDTIWKKSNMWEKNTIIRSSTSNRPLVHAATDSRFLRIL
ncbi:hypothetical protein TNIN_332961 [Trichonephila inaurata madagascariensis]|uniref:Uncharacterized protein n=1 Tax=Trichonephila inaurata madagascariensis TaxID=2747483 RepID=A0A8X7CCL1_9ARAC|nr:hypothetical protein TNIN_332961 [Trichonephila inaurata madagascariensis]